MKRSKINLAMVAMLVAVTAAFAFKAPQKTFAQHKYGYDQSIPVNQNRWVLIDNQIMDNSPTAPAGTYRCDASSEKCSGLFTTAPTSSSAVPDAGTQVNGDFSLN